MHRINSVNYLLLLLMITNQQENISLDSKILNIIKFMHTKLSCIFERELVLAIEFMTASFRCGFFNKVNNGSKNILQKLRNMAWDMTLLRYVEEVTKTKATDFMVPFVVSYDDEFLKLFDLYPVKSLLINKINNLSYTRPGKDIIDLLLASIKKEDLEPYFTEEAAKTRQSRINRELDLNEMITSLEGKVNESRGLF